MSGKIFARRHTAAEDDNPYWISFSDIMSGLLIIFVLASLALILELRDKVDKVTVELAMAEQVRRDILEEIQETLKIKNIEVEISDNHTVLRIPDSTLTFATNRHSIPLDEAMRTTVLEIGLVLYEAISKEERWHYLDTIFVEGHTDRRPSYRDAMGNWGLSTYRAISVWNYWNENLPESKRLNERKNHNGAPLFSVSGYGETRPVQVVQETETDWQKNRRIDIRFTVRQPALEEFKNLKDLRKMLEDRP